MSRLHVVEGIGHVGDVRFDVGSPRLESVPFILAVCDGEVVMP